MGNLSYDDLRVYQGHPFLQFTGVPSRKLSSVVWRTIRARRPHCGHWKSGNEALGNLADFNNFGFVGRDFKYKKPNGVVRIAALGASTTARGYPALLEEFLNAKVQSPTKSFEVMNFGLGHYTSANTLTNFVLNVVDFAPDVIIIHHGWNDIHARAKETVFRGDYGHHLKIFQPPRLVIDRYLIRTSILYRAGKFFIGPPPWAFVEFASQVPRVPPERPLNQRELGTFQRNIETITNLARLGQIKVVLTTMPRTTDEAKPQYEDHQ